MEGRNILDPQGVESPQSYISGLGLLPVETVFKPVKATHQAEARILGGPDWLAPLQGQTIQGYEIHMGRTTSQRPWLTITRHSTPPTSLLDGAADATGRVWGCYLHGLFANTALRRAWLTSLGWRASVQPVGAVTSLQVALDTLASQVGASLDMQRLQGIVWAD